MAADHRPLSPTELRLPCEPEQLPFESTEELEPLHGVIGQEDAVESLRFGLEVHAPGQNVYVRGLVGTGRQALVKQLLQDIQPACPLSDDLCYVHDFEEPDRPRLIRIPRGKGASFREAVEELASYIETSFGDALGEDTLRGRRKELEDGLREQLEALGAPFDKELREAGLGMLQSQGPGGEVQPVILPVIEEQPAPPERLQQLLAGAVQAIIDVVSRHGRGPPRPARARGAWPGPGFSLCEHKHFSSVQLQEPGGRPEGVRIEPPVTTAS